MRRGYVLLDRRAHYANTSGAGSATSVSIWKIVTPESQRGAVLAYKSPAIEEHRGDARDVTDAHTLHYHGPREQSYVAILTLPQMSYAQSLIR